MCRWNYPELLRAPSLQPKQTILPSSGPCPIIRTYVCTSRILTCLKFFMSVRPGFVAAKELSEQKEKHDAKIARNVVCDTRKLASVWAPLCWLTKQRDCFQTENTVRTIVTADRSRYNAVAYIVGKHSRKWQVHTCLLVQPSFFKIKFASFSMLKFSFYIFKEIMPSCVITIYGTAVFWEFRHFPPHWCDDKSKPYLFFFFVNGPGLWAVQIIISRNFSDRPVLQHRRKIS